MSGFLPRRIVPATLYEITGRTHAGDHWLAAELRDPIEQALGRAAAVAEVTLFGYVFMSNHYHLLVRLRGPRQLAKFLQILHAEVARAVNRRHKRRGKVWCRRADVVPVSAEPEAHLRRLAYVMANGVKEGLVEHPRDWWGPHCARQFVERPVGVKTVVGTPETRKSLEEIPQRYTVELAPLPHLANLPPEAWRRAMRRMTDRIAAWPTDREAWLEPHLLDPQVPLLPEPPHPQRPTATHRTRVGQDSRRSAANREPGIRSTTPPVRERKRDPWPVHAYDPAVRTRMRNELKEFCQAYAESSAAFREGHPDVRFPPHCIMPPAQPPETMAIVRLAA